MYFSTAAALLFGLGTRIVLDKFYSDSSEVVESTVGDVILLGVIQGVGLYYALMEWAEFAFVVAFGIAARLAMEFAVLQDMSKCALTLLGVAIGVLFTDVLSQLIEDGYFYDYNTSSERGSVYAPKKRKRLVKFQRSDEYTVIEDRQPPSRPRRASDAHRRRDWSTTDLTGPPSLSSNSDTVDPTLPPLEREVAVLRARASLADSERRRFKEEKKWAISQGNLARASQMSWQVKRYSALTQSFQREADARLLEVTAARTQQQEVRTTTQRTERHHSERHTNHARQQPGTSTTRQIFTREPTQEVVLDRNSNVTLDFGRHQTQRHRKQSGGTLKSAIRLQVR